MEIRGESPKREERNFEKALVLSWARGRGDVFAVRIRS